MNDPRTYNDDMLNEMSRGVFYKSMQKLNSILDSQEPQNPERMHALAAVADAAACGFKSEDDEDEY